MNNGLIFSVQTMQTNVGGSLRSIHPDDDGVYRDVPVAVIGKPSRNNAMYDPSSFVNAITNPNTKFNRSLVEGGLFGEWEHPSAVGLNEDDAVRRAMEVRLDTTSHYFTKVYSKTSPDGKYIVVYADIVPSGPKGKYLIEGFADPKRNVAFSLRSITARNPVKANNIYMKKIIALITFDGASIGGFEESCKRYMQVGTEELAYTTSDETIIDSSMECLVNSPNCSSILGMESVDNQSMLDMLESNSITVSIKDEPISGTLSSTGGLITKKGHISAFHGLYT